MVYAIATRPHAPTRNSSPEPPGRTRAVGKVPDAWKRNARVVEITSLADFRDRPVRKVASHHIPRLKRVFAHVEAHLDSRLRVAELAGVACLSPAQFTRVFKAFTGQSPHQFILDCRVKAACRLIRRGGSSLACVAMDVGFASQSHMTDVFRCRIGMSPGMVADAMPADPSNGVPQRASVPVLG